MPTTKERRDELRRLLAAATPRPWTMGSVSPDGKLILAAVNALPDLLSALDEAERIAESRDVINRTYASTVDLLSSDLRSAIAERDLYMARGEALERACRIHCCIYSCANSDTVFECGSNICHNLKLKDEGNDNWVCVNWQFNEAKYTKGGDSV